MFLSFSFPSQPLDYTQTCLLSPPIYVAPMNRLGWRNEQSGERERESGRVVLRGVEERVNSVKLSPGQQHTVQTHKRRGANKQMPTQRKDNPKTPFSD